MFRRLILEDTAALFTLTAFITAVSIYVAVAWRALHMKRPQVERFGNLPFGVATPEATGPLPTARPERDSQSGSRIVE